MIGRSTDMGRVYTRCVECDANACTRFENGRVAAEDVAADGIFGCSPSTRYIRLVTRPQGPSSGGQGEGECVSSKVN